MKLLGLLMLFLSIVSVGASYATRLRERVRLLKAFKELMLTLKRRFSVSRPSLAELFQTDSDPLTQPFSRAIYEGIGSGESPVRAAEAAFSSPCAVRLLKSAERAYLCGVVASLAEGDVSSVLGTLDSAADELGAFIAEASEHEKKNAKTGLALSFYIGLAVVIMLL